MTLTEPEAFEGDFWTVNHGRATIGPFSKFPREAEGGDDAVPALAAAFCFFNRRASRSASCSGVGVNVAADITQPTVRKGEAVGDCVGTNLKL
jgi:hypothetical protein